MISPRRLRNAFSKKLRAVVQEQVEKYTQPNIVVPEQQNLMTQIDSKRIDAIEKAVLTLAIGVQKLIEETKKTQELMVHVATLHEELLHQLDQGNIAMVRVTNNKDSDMDDDFDAMLHEHSEPVKKKTEFN